MSAFVLDNDLDGGLVLADASALAALSDELRYALEAALDEEGRTELAYDFPGEPWASVYARVTGPLREVCARGAWLFEDLGPGRFHCALEVEEPGSPARELAS